MVNTAKQLLSICSKKKYDVVLIDCPWSYFGDGQKMGAAAKEYNLMSQADIEAMQIKSLLKKNACVFVWATCPRLDLAISAIRSWGLHYRGVAFVWVKTNKKGNIIAGQGVPPTFTKPTTELLLLATTKKTGRPLKLRKYNQAQVILASRTNKHSEKPEVFRQHIVDVFDNGDTLDKLEVFAREITPGWDCVGNEICGEDVNVSVGKLNGSLPFFISAGSSSQAG